MLTMRGLLNRDFEGLGAFVWGAVATMMVAFGPPENALELENFDDTILTRLILLRFAVKKKAPYALASGLCVKYSVEKVPRFFSGSVNFYAYGCSTFFYVKINSAENLPKNSIWSYGIFARNPNIRFSNRQFSLNGGTGQQLAYSLRQRIRFKPADDL